MREVGTPIVCASCDGRADLAFQDGGQVWRNRQLNASQRGGESDGPTSRSTGQSTGQ
jgi:hypothetical protein